MSDANANTATTSASILQTFSTIFYPDDSRLPELAFTWMRADEKSAIANDASEDAIKQLNRFFEDGEPQNEDMRIINVFNKAVGGGPINVNTISAKIFFILELGMVGDTLFDHPDLQGTVSKAVNSVAIPVQNSPLKDMTLSGIVAGSSSTIMLDILRNGATPGEAMLAVLVLSGAIIIFGAANAVRRAIDIGLEIKLLSLFGLEEAKEIALGRLMKAETERSRVAKKREKRIQLSHGIPQQETIVSVDVSKPRDRG